MDRPRVARKNLICWISVLHQCIRLHFGAAFAPSHHGYQRAGDLVSGKASIGLSGSSVFACAGKTVPPSLLPSRRPRRVPSGMFRLFSNSVQPTAVGLIGLLDRRCRHLIGCDDLEVALLGQDSPSDACQFVGKRDRQHVRVQPFGRCLDPRLETVPFPALGLAEHDPGGLDKQGSEVTITAL